MLFDTYLASFIEFREELTGDGKQLRDRVEGLAFGAVETVALLEVSETSDGHLRWNPRHSRTLRVKRVPELNRFDDESLQQKSRNIDWF